MGSKRFEDTIVRNNPKYVYHTFPSVHLYVEDLLKIEKILKGDDSKSVEIVTDDTIFESINEFIEFSGNDTFKSLTIKLLYPHHLIVEIGRRTNSIQSMNDTNEVRGMIDRLLGVLKHETRVFTKLYIIVALIIGVSIFFYFSYSFRSSPSLLVYLSLIFISLLLGYIIPSIFFLNYNKVFLRRKRDKISFWKRKRDDIWVALISTIIGTIIGTTVTLLLKK